MRTVITWPGPTTAVTARAFKSSCFLTNVSISTLNPFLSLLGLKNTTTDRPGARISPLSDRNSTDLRHFAFVFISGKRAQNT